MKTRTALFAPLLWPCHPSALTSTPGVIKTPGPRWQICPEQNAILFPIGDSVPLKLEIDFLRAVSEGMSPRLEGRVYEIPKLPLDYSQDPQELMKFVREDQHAARLVIDLHYRLDAWRLEWRLGDWEAIYGSASDDPRLTANYEKVAHSMPVLLDAYRQVRRVPGDEWLDLREQLERMIKTGSGLGDSLTLTVNVPGRWALDFDPEQSGNSTTPNRDNGWENEVRVARTFWDLHDTRADGSDVLWLTTKARL